MSDSSDMIGQFYIEKAEPETEAGSEVGSDTSASGSFSQDAGAQPPLPSDLEGLRQATKQLLARAAGNGELESTLGGLRAGSPDLSSQLQRTRAVIKDLLITATKEGRLQKAFTQIRSENMAQVKDAELEDIRQQVKETLFSANADGRLKKLLCPARTSSQLDDFRKDLKEALTAAANNGNLSRAMQEVKLNNMRAKAREALSRSALDGTLVAELKNIKQVQETKANDLRQQIKEAVLSAAVTGQLHSELEALDSRKAAAAEAEPEGEPTTPGNQRDIERLREQALAALQRALRSGHLPQVLADVQHENDQKNATKKTQEAGEDLRGRLRQLLRGASLDGRLEGAVREVKAQQEEAAEALNVLKQARQDLKTAALDGRLGQALVKVKQQEQGQEAREVVIEDLRTQARNCLLKAAADGTIQCLVNKAQKPNIEAARATAREALGRAAADGSLQALLGRTRQAQDLEQSRNSARAILAKAALDGRLGATLGSLQPRRPRKEDAAAEACSILSAAAMDGRLREALVEARRSRVNPSKEALRLQAQETLFKGALDGRLSQVIQEVKAQKTEDAQKAASDTVSNETKDDPATLDIAAMRSELQAMLAGSARSGQLAEALRARRPEAKAETPQEDAQEIVSEARSVLVAAVQDGRLAALRRGQLERSEEAAAPGEVPEGMPAPPAPQEASPPAPQKPAVEPTTSLEEEVENVTVSRTSKRLNCETSLVKRLRPDFQQTARAIRYEGEELPGAQAQLPSPKIEDRPPTPRPGSSGERRAAAKEPPAPRGAGGTPSSRQRRRIIGAVERTPKAALCLDLTEDAGTQDDAPPAAKPSSRAGRPQPSPTPPSSRRSARHRVHLAVSSAMAQDLGDEFAGAPAAAGEDCNPVAASAMALDLDLGLGGSRWGGSSRTATPTNRLRSSHSVGSMRVTKLQGGAGMTFAMPQAYSTKATTTTLPALQGQRRAPAAVAWSQQLSWNPSRWGS